MCLGEKESMFLEIVLENLFEMPKLVGETELL